MRGIWEQFGRHVFLFEVLFNTLFFGDIATHARGLGAVCGSCTHNQHRGKTVFPVSFSVTLSSFQSDQSLPRALGFILGAPCGSVVLLHAACVFDYFVVIESAFMDNQAQITETISLLDSEKVR